MAEILAEWVVVLTLVVLLTAIAWLAGKWLTMAAALSVRRAELADEFFDAADRLIDAPEADDTLREIIRTMTQMLEQDRLVARMIRKGIASGAIRDFRATPIAQERLSALHGAIKRLPSELRDVFEEGVRAWSRAILWSSMWSVLLTPQIVGRLAGRPRNGTDRDIREAETVAAYWGQFKPVM